MRFRIPALVSLLVISLIFNGVLWLKYRSRRAILTVEGVEISKYDMDTYLEGLYGPDFKANQALHILIHKEAVAKGVSVTDEAVNKKFQEAKATDWQFAWEMNTYPWQADRRRADIRAKMEIDRLLAKDVPVTDDDIRDEYNLAPVVYDTPNRAETNVALMNKDTHLNEVIQMLSKDPPIKPSSIMDSYRNDVRFIGDNYVYTFLQRFGTNEQNAIFSMQPRTVKRVAPTPEFGKAGYSSIVIRLNAIIPGHKADLNDPETKEQIRLAVALKRARPVKELMRDLLQKAKIWSEDPSDIDTIRRAILKEDTGKSK